MDKQEIIDFIDEAIGGTDYTLRNSDIDNADQQIALNDSLIELKLIKKYLYQLEKPEQPKIPQWLAGCIKAYDIDSVAEFWRNFFMGSIFNPGERAWILDNDDIINKIFLYGYDIEKEPVWVVKGHHGYLIELKVNKDHTGWVQETTGDPEDKYIIKFNNKEDAERAKVVVKDGKVEEWSE